MAIEVTAAVFEPVETDPNEEVSWTLRISVTGSGFIARAKPVVAQVGDTPVEGIMLLPDGGGFLGFLSSAPPIGARLVVGYLDEAMVETDVAFEPPIA
jgi:hypothetical protein